MSTISNIREQYEELYDRPHPKKMALSCLFDEVDGLSDLLDDAKGDENEVVTVRYRKIGRVLEERLDIQYPSCPDCGQRTLGREYDGVVVCIEGYCDLPTEVRDEWECEDRRKWGLRGHGGTARDASCSGQGGEDGGE